MFDGWNILHRYKVPNDYKGYFGDDMTTWRATKAKAQFSAMLDKAENEGPQLVTRRNRVFYVLTK